MNTNEHATTVALVLDKEFGGHCLDLQKSMPVWIVDSPQNQLFVDRIRLNRPAEDAAVTVFQIRENELLSSVCERIVQSVDDHHNEFSQTPGYSELDVFGVSLADVSLRPFMELGFEEFVKSSTGFIARKGSRTQT